MFLKSFFCVFSFRESYEWSWILLRYIQEYQAHREFCSDSWESANISSDGSNKQFWTRHGSTLRWPRKHWASYATGNVQQNLTLLISYFFVISHGYLESNHIALWLFFTLNSTKTSFSTPKRYDGHANHSAKWLAKRLKHPPNPSLTGAKFRTVLYTIINNTTWKLPFLLFFWQKPCNNKNEFKWILQGQVNIYNFGSLPKLFKKG